ncbi:MAG: sucrose-specific PTS transporter subunit IIBC [Clostridium perfringens]|nr:sucrose-specific PTS transporter subunit IIBC [Clostridium perfringens]
MSKNYKQIANEILNHIGGKGNIISAAHCATRLRLVLKDDKKVNTEAIEKIPMVKGSFNNSGQFQIVLGSGIVNEVYKEFIRVANVDESSKEALKVEADRKLNPLQRLIKSLASVFVPVLPILVAAGLLMGINNILTSQGLFIEGKSLIEAYPKFKDLAEMINTFANTGFAFLPIFLGFSATKTFGGNPYLGACIGALMIHGDLLNGYSYPSAVLEGNVPYWNILGFSILKVGYQGTVLPVLASSYILSKVEKILHRVIPSVLDNLLTPLFTVFITGLLTFIAIGPIMRIVGDGITTGLIGLISLLGPIGGCIFGFFYAPIVITGMHHSFTAVETQLLADIATTGGSFIFPVAAMSNVAQGAAALAVIFVLKKDKKMKGIASASGISALLGITEPAIFGVNLKLRYPFYGAMIGSAVASGYIMFTKVLALAPGAAGLPGVISIRPDSMINYMIGMIIAMSTAIISTVILAKIMGKNESKIMQPIG